MKRSLHLIFLLFVGFSAFSQVKNKYSISFDNVEHHEATVTCEFSNLQQGKVILEMAQKTPDAYGVYHFAKNIYNLEITGSNGKDLRVNQLALNKWEVERHNGGIEVKYTIFGDTLDGIHSIFSVDQTFVNNPATFMFIEALESRPVEITYQNRRDLGWKLATSLKRKGSSSTFEASDLQEFMDSPVFLANFISKEKEIEVGSEKLMLKLALKDTSGEELAEDLLAKVSQAIVEQQKVFGSFPSFENNTYTFMASFSSKASHNVLAHRSSSFILNSEPLSDQKSVHTQKVFAEAFMKTWNKFRISPITLKPFDFQKNTLTKEFWFTEGFSSYYALVSMVRAGVISKDKFYEEMAIVVNEAITSPAFAYNNASEMSEKSLFYAGKNNFGRSKIADNLHIPYNTHGFIIALILDLELREKKDELDLDDFMSLLWAKYGRTGIAFSVDNLYATLREYAGDSFAENFYKKNITEPMEFEVIKLLESFGVSATYVELPYLGVDVAFNGNSEAVISTYTNPKTPAYNAGLEKGDVINSIDGQSFTSLTQFKNTIAQQKIADKVKIKYTRFGQEKNTSAVLEPNPFLILSGMLKTSSSVDELNNSWLGNN